MHLNFFIVFFAKIASSLSAAKGARTLVGGSPSESRDPGMSSHPPSLRLFDASSATFDSTSPSSSSSSSSDPCINSNGGCSHFCIAETSTSRGSPHQAAVCSCPPYMILSVADSKTCFFPSVADIPGQMRHVPPKVLLVETFDRRKASWATLNGRIRNATCGFAPSNAFSGIDFSGSPDRWRIVESPSFDLTQYEDYLDIVRFKILSSSFCENSGSNHGLKLEYQKNGEPWVIGKLVSLLIPSAVPNEAQLFSFETMDTIPLEMRSTNTRVRLVQESDGQAWALDEIIVYKIMYDACRTHSCQNGASCEMETSRTYFCHCPPNYFGSYCEIASPCLVANGGCSHECAFDFTSLSSPHSSAGVVCSCPENFVLGLDERTCEVFRPQCLVNNGGCSHQCVDLVESQDHYCACPPDRVVSVVDGRTCVYPETTSVAGSIPNSTPTFIFADSFHRAPKHGWVIQGGEMSNSVCGSIPYSGYEGVDFSGGIRFRRRIMTSPEVDLTQFERHLDLLVIKVVTNGACPSSGTETSLNVEFRRGFDDEWILAKTLSLDVGSPDAMHIVRFLVVVPPETRSTRTQFRLMQAEDGAAWSLDEVVLFKAVVDVCRSHRCRNGATCEMKSGDSYTCSCPPGFSGRFCEFSDPCDFENGGCSHGCRRRGATRSSVGVSAVDVLMRCYCPPPLTLASDSKTCVSKEQRFEELLRNFGYIFSFNRLCFFENWESRAPGTLPAGTSSSGDRRRDQWELQGGVVTDRVCVGSRSTGRTNVLFSGAGARYIVTPEISLEPITGNNEEFIVVSFAVSIWGGLRCDPLETDDEIVAEIKFNAVPDMEWQVAYRLAFTNIESAGYATLSFSLPTTRTARLLRINSLVRIRLRQLTHEGRDTDVWTLKEFAVGIVSQS